MKNEKFSGHTMKPLDKVMVFSSRELDEFNEDMKGFSDIPMIQDDGHLGFSLFMNSKKLCWLNRKGERLLFEHLRKKLDPRVNEDTFWEQNGEARKVAVCEVKNGNARIIWNEKDWEGIVRGKETWVPLQELSNSSEKGEVKFSLTPEFMKAHLMNWLEEINPHYSGIVDYNKYIEEEDNKYSYVVKVKLYTEKYRYSIIARLKDKSHMELGSSNAYLGCQVSNRYWRPGEDWHRGRDLPDGTFTYQTWNQILRAIVGIELVQKDDVISSKPILKGRHDGDSSNTDTEG